MIQLTRLNNQPLVVNSDLISFIENKPDTVLTLITGEKVVVRESTEQILDLIVDYRRRLLTCNGTIVPTFAQLSRPGHSEGEVL